MKLFFVIESLCTPGSYFESILSNGLFNYTTNLDKAQQWTIEDEARGCFKLVQKTFNGVRLVLVTQQPAFTFEEVSR